MEKQLLLPDRAVSRQRLNVTSTRFPVFATINAGVRGQAHSVSEQAPSAHKQVAGMAQDQKEGEIQVFPSILHKLRAANPTTRAPVLCLALGRCSQMLLS